MAQLQVNLDLDQLKTIFADDQTMTQLVEQMLNQILEAQVAEHIGAQRYERSEDRQAYRNGYRLRRLTMRVGTLTLKVPQTRDGSFSTALFARYQRSEQALVLAMMEMVLQGVSTRKVKRITEQLCGSRFSKSTVSRLCKRLDARVSAWRERPLGKMPFVLVDALVIKVRRDEAVRATSGLPSALTKRATVQPQLAVRSWVFASVKVRPLGRPFSLA